MEEYIQVTVRCEGRKDMDIRVHEKQTWERITEILHENGLLPKPATGFTYKSLRQKTEFAGSSDSKELGIYTGDIIELGGY